MSASAPGNGWTALGAVATVRHLRSRRLSLAATIHAELRLHDANAPLAIRSSQDPDLRHELKALRQARDLLIQPPPEPPVRRSSPEATLARIGDGWID